MKQLSKKYLKRLIVVAMLFVVSITGFSFAWFNYYQEGGTSQIISGSLYLVMNEGTDTINVEGVFPQTKEEARASNDNYITFTVSGKNTSGNDIGYEIKLNNGNDKNGKTRFNAEDLVFDLSEIDENDNETLILDAVSYDEFNEKKIWVDKVEKNTNSEVEKTYKLRMWLSDSVTISDTDTNATYKATGVDAFKNHYASVKVAVEADLTEKYLPLAVESNNNLISNGNVYISNTIENSNSTNAEDVFELTVTSSNSNVEFIYDPSDVSVTNIDSENLNIKASLLINEEEKNIIKKIDNEIETTNSFSKQYTLANNEKVSFDIQLSSKTGKTEPTDLKFVLKKNNVVVQELVKHIDVVGISYGVNIDVDSIANYDGNPLDLGVTVTNPDGSAYTGQIEYTYYSGAKCEGTPLVSAPVNTGTYCVKIRVPASGEVKETIVEKVVQITKGNSTVQITSAGGTYNGNPISAVVNPNTATVRYYNNSSCTGSSTEQAPTNAGTYYIKASVYTNENQIGAESECVIHEITSKSLQDGVTVQTGTYTYNGQGKEPTVTVNDGATTLVAGTDYDVVYSNNINAGQATITVTMKGNYAGEFTEHFTINKAVIDSNSLAPSDKTYNGNSQNHGIQVPNGVSIVNEGSTLSATNVGSYNVVLGIDDTNNYKWNDNTSSNKEISWNIVKSNTTTTMNELDIAYDGNFQEASGATSKLSSNNSAIANGNYTYVYYSNNNCTTVTTTPKEAGTYYVIATLAGTDNYNSSSSQCTKMTISNCAATLEFTSNSLSLTYGTNGEMSYTYNGDGTLSCSLSDNTVATCSVDTTNHKINLVPLKATTSAVTVTVNATAGVDFGATSKSFSLTINKKTVTITAKDQTVEYGTDITKNTNQVTVTGLKTNDSLDSITLTQSKTSVSSDGKITPSSAVIKDNQNNTVTSNYNISYVDGDLIINKKQVTASVSSCDNKTYDGTTSATCTLNALTGIIGTETVSATLGTCTFDNKNVGNSKTVTCSGISLDGTNKGNYELTSTSATKTANITAKTVTVTADSKSMTYGGSAPTYSYTVTGAIGSETAVSGTATYTIKSGNTEISNVSTASVGAYDIVPSGLTAGSNYSISYTNGTLTINVSKTASEGSCINPTYSGSAQNLAGNGSHVTYSGNSQTNVKTDGDYSVSVTPAANYAWSDGTTTAKTLSCNIQPLKCSAPTSVSIASSGAITWTASSNCSSAQHQVKVASGSYANATSGVNKNNDITADTGIRTVYVKAIAPNANYIDSDEVSKSTTVFSVTLTKGTGIDTVTGAGNYITGSTVTLGATVSEGYAWTNWTQTSGGTEVSTNNAYSGTITSNWAYTANAEAIVYTATFYYKGASGVTSITQSCTVTSGTSCNVTIPNAIKSSTGTYSNAYAGLSSSSGNMTSAVASNATTVTLSADAEYYAIYSSQVTINYPYLSNSIVRRDDEVARRNQWLSSKTTLADTVLSTTTTGTTNNYSFTSNASGYDLYGFATDASSNTRTYNDVAALKTSSATTVYAILYKEVTVTFKYSNADTGSATSTTATGNKYLRCESVGAGVSGETLSPSITETAPKGTVAVGWASTFNAMSTVTPTTANTTYYRVYSQPLTIYYPTSPTEVTSANDKIYRNAYLTTSSATTYTIKTTLSATSTAQVDVSNVTADVLPDMYATFDGLSETINTTSYNSIFGAATQPYTTYYAVNSYQENVEVTFYYSNSNTGSKTSSTDNANKTMIVYCKTESEAKVIGGSQGILTPPSTTAPYGTSLLGWASSATSLTIRANITTGYTSYYAIYGSDVTNYYYDSTNSNYTTRTLYRRGLYKSATNYTMSLSSASNSATNISVLEAGPGSSVWSGLSTAADTTAEYATVAAAAASESSNLYTIYQFNVNYNKGSNVDSIGSTTGNCKVKAMGAHSGSASCGVVLPSITPNTGYTSVGWSTTNGDITGTAAGGYYEINTNPTTLYANAIASVLTFSNQTLTSGTYGTAYTSEAFTGASNGTGSYTYTIKSGAPTGATIDSTNRTISFTNTTNAGTYSVVVTATDDNSGATKDATMTIVIAQIVGTNSVEITGTNTWGSTLTATITTNSPGTKEYKWYYNASNSTSGGTAIEDTNCDTGNTCVIPSSVVGKYIYVVGSVGSSTNYTTPSNSTDITDATANTNATVGKKTCPAPTNVSIATDKKVSWTNASGASSYQISMSSSSEFAAHTNGAAYNSITSSTGSRTVYVRSVCDTDLYSSANSSNASASTTVYSVTLTAGTGIASVSGGGNFITGASTTISATVSSGYVWINWTGSSTYTNQSQSITVDENKSFTANANEVWAENLSYDNTNSPGIDCTGDNANVQCALDYIAEMLN